MAGPVPPNASGLAPRFFTQGSIAPFGSVGIDPVRPLPGSIVVFMAPAVVIPSVVVVAPVVILPAIVIVPVFIAPAIVVAPLVEVVISPIVVGIGVAVADVDKRKRWRKGDLRQDA